MTTSGVLAPLVTAALGFSAVRAPGQAVAPVAFRQGEIAFAVQVSGAPDFVGHAAVSAAEFSGSEIGAVRGYAEVRVADMRTGVGLRDRHMRGALEAGGFPTIRFSVTSVVPGAGRGDTANVVLHGRLTIRDQTRDVSVQGRVVFQRGAVDVHAAFPVDMRDFGVEPPTRFLGAIRVQPVVQVTVRLGFGPAPDGP